MTHGTCESDGCSKPVAARGLCKTCHTRLRRAEKRQQAPAPEPRACEVCGADITERRSHARVCSSSRCRNAARRKLPRMWTQVEPQQCTVVENGERCPEQATHRLRTDRWCRKHCARYERQGDPAILTVVRRPAGEVQEYLRQSAQSDTSECILLPSPTKGRLTVSYQGKPMTAARAVWIIARDDPGPDVHVLHTCHRGDDGCVNIRHLYLGDHEQNMVDMIESDRAMHGERHVRHKLTEIQVREIVRRARAGENQRRIAEMFAITPSHVSNLKRGRSWWRITRLGEP